VRRLVARLGTSIIVRNRAFRLLWTGCLLSNAGSWLLQVAVPLEVYRLTGSARDTGLTVVAEVVPLLILSSAGGVAADRLRRQRIMIAANLAEAGCVSLLMLASSRGQLWLVLLAICAENCGAAFFGPACTAFVPDVVGRGADLPAASAWTAFSSGVVRLAGAPLGAALYAVAGFRLPVTADAASYLASALLISLIRFPAAGPHRRAVNGQVPASAAEASRRQGPVPGRRRWRSALKALVASQRSGLTALRTDRVLAVLLWSFSLFLLGNGALSALLVPYVVSDLHVRAATVGVLFSALGAGYLASAYLGRRACASARLRRTVAALLAEIVLAFAGLFDIHAAGPAFVFIALAGLGGGAFLMLEQTLLQRRAARQVAGRIASAYATAGMASTLAGALLGSLAAGWLGRAIALNLAIAVIAAGAAVALRLPATITKPARPSGRRPEPVVADSA
jgi:predicted MFS family arabinose efflux permease